MMNRKALHSVLGSFVFALAMSAVTPADAQTAGACYVHSTSKLDALMNPVLGGDERFFRSSGGTPNVLVILDSSEKMRGWASPWPTTPGCSHAQINDLGYNPNYPSTPPAYQSSWQNYNSLNSNWFDTTKFYDIAAAGYGVKFNNAPANTSIYSSADNACGLLSGVTLLERPQCMNCLATRGYWIKGLSLTSTVGRVAGNFLNFYGPRDSGSNGVLNRLLHDLGGYRFSSISLAMSGAGQKCWRSGQGSVGFICEVFDFRSCGSTTTPSSAITGINSIEWGDSASTTQNAQQMRNPAGSSLIYAAASKVRSATPDAFTSASGIFPSCVGSTTCTSANLTETSGNLGMCADCEFAAIIYISAGAGSAPNQQLTLPTEITGLSVPCNGCNPNDLNLPKVAKWFWEHDLRLDTAFPSRNRVATYTIGFMDPATSAPDELLLKRTALVGGGKYYRATSTVGLKDAILQALDDISNRPTQFASASLASVQTSGGDLAALLPRLAPQADQPWIGDLLRFKQFNEFVENVDLNGANGKNDVFLLDSQDHIVQENSAGELVRKNAPSTKATPLWDARQKLKQDGHAARKIWTVVDSTNDGRFTSSDAMKEVTGTEFSTLAPYLGVLGTSHCPTAGIPVALGRMIEKFGFQSVSAASAALPAAIRPSLSILPTQTELNELCVKLLIQFARGQDLADENANDDRTETRESVLGDIFHSSPALVDPPVDRFLCEQGLHSQCLLTLYATAEDLGVAATPSAAYSDQTVTVGGNTCKVPILAAYDLYRHNQRKREKVVLVGANDGMLHAFQAGAVPSGGETCDAGFLSATYNYGTGAEKWAFIPPDQLPRLIDSVYGHQYMMDGDIMVRDVWVDGSGASTERDGTKQADEFHTVAITAEGRGGVHYFGVKVTFESDQITASRQPKFLWMFPQPGSDEAALFGKTLFSVSPRPPPIGPVLISSNDSSDTPTGIIASNGEAPTRYDAPSVERWVAWLSGGWSPGREKGRGVYMVDAYWGNLRTEGGVTNGRTDNLWWKFEFNPSASGEQMEPRKYLTSSIVAPVAMVDYGRNNDLKRDGFFDTGIVGDTMGQVFTLRYQKPGKLDATTGLIKNWAAARSFEMDKNGGTNIANRGPFHFLASVGIQPTTNALRVMMGSGDRYELLGDGAGRCQFDDPTACAKYGCTDVRVRYAVNKAGINVTDAQNYWQGRTLNTATVASTPNSPALGACGSSGTLGTSTAPVQASYRTFATGTCSNLTTPASPWPTSLNEVSVSCGRDAAGNFRCEKTAGNTYTKKLGDPNSTALTGLGNNRFFGFWAYGGDRVFDEDRTATQTGSVTARQFDALRLSDRTTTNTTSGDLVDVTAGTTTAGDSSRGWVYRYSALNRKTASAGSLIAGCSLWNVVYPEIPAATACPDNRQAQKLLFQANFITGGSGCAPGFGTGRFTQASASAPPPEPVSIVQASKTGKIRYSSLVGDGINFQPITVNQTNDVLQSLYEVPIPQSLHQCRHEDPTGTGTCELGDKQQLMLAP